MSSSPSGEDTSQISVTDISPDGVWLLVSDEEFLMPFTAFPWFKKATVEQILNVREDASNSFYWPDLDIDLSLSSIRNPEAYPSKQIVK